jgi:hypothetical protein
VTEAIVPSHQPGLVVRSRNRVLFFVVKDGRRVKREGVATKEIGVRSKLGGRR